MVRSILFRPTAIKSVVALQKRFNSWIVDYANLSNVERLACLNQTVLPAVFEKGVVADRDLSSFQKQLCRTKGAFKTSLQLRDDIRSLLKNKPETVPGEEWEKQQGQMKQLDQSIQKWLGYTLNNDCLELKRITFETSSGSVLEKVARGESVHKVRTLRELKKRLHDGKRCFALFHPKLEDEPLVFIHVGLTNELSGSLR